MISVPFEGNSRGLIHVVKPEELGDISCQGASAEYSGIQNEAQGVRGQHTCDAKGQDC